MIYDPAAIDKALLIALPIGEAIVVIMLLKKNLWKTLPLFCLYIFWGFLSDMALYDIFTRHPERYQRFYTFETIIDSVLMFSVLVELGWSVLRPIRASLPKATILVLIALVGVAGLIIWPLASRTTPPGMDKASLLLFHLQETFAILRVVCFLVMAGLSQVLSIGWRDRELQIATGFGVYAIVSLLVMLLHAQSTRPFADPYHWLDVAVSISYLGTLSYWVLSFATKEQERKDFSPQMQHLLLQLGGGARAGRIALGDLPSSRFRDKDK